MKQILFALIALTSLAAQAETLESCVADFHSIFDTSPETITVTKDPLHAHIGRDASDGKHYDFDFSGTSSRELMIDDKLDANLRSIAEYNVGLFARHQKKSISLNDVHSYRVYEFTYKDGDEMTFSVLRDATGKIILGDYNYKNSPGLFGACRL